MSKAQYKPLGFREFLIGDLFDVKGTNQVFQNDELDVYDNQTDIYNVPYVVRKDGDNGIKGYVDGSLVHSDDLNQGNVITFAQDTFVSYYQPYPFITGNKIKILIFKDGDLSFNLSQWFVSGINKLIKGLSWGTGSTVASIKELTIQLPVLANNQPDYEYMDYFVEELKHKYVEELDDWWSQAGFASLSDTLLTGNDQDILNKYQQAQFKDFLIGDLFDKVKVKTFNGGTGDLPSQKVGDYVLPMLTAGINHQGLNNYDTYEDDVTVLKNVISISANGANTGAAFFQSQEFGILQDAYAIDFKDQNRNYTENVYLYVLSVIDKKFEGKFSWTLKAGWNRVKELSIQLPVDINDLPDYDLISQYMQVMKKLTVQAHRGWLDEQLAAYQSLI